MGAKSATDRNGFHLGQLRARFTGSLVWPGDTEYDRARQIWNGMFDRRPALVARCVGAQDVAAALRYAAAVGRPVTVRGGGHNVAGTSIADDAVLIDLSLMRRVAVDADARLARAEGGALLSDLDTATTAHGLACPVGVVSRTGIGGLILGGGYGWLSRKWGLACDHIVGAEVVLADGTIVEATENRNSDLLWGLRGGGGNFGVVTRFTLRLRPVTDVRYRTALYPARDAAAVLAAYGELAPAQSNDAQATVTLRHAAHADWVPEELRGTAVLALSSVWLGDPDDQADEPLFTAVRPAASSVRTMPYLELQRMGDDSEPAGQRYYTKSCYLSDITASVAELLVDATVRSPSRLSTIDLGYLRGAISDVESGATAFPRRDAAYICSGSAAWLEAVDDQKNIAWSRGLIGDLQPWQQGGAYINYAQQERSETVATIYGTEHHSRLVRLKDRFDPTNTFRGNQNIRPTALSGTAGNQETGGRIRPPGSWGNDRGNFGRALRSPWYRLVSDLEDVFVRATVAYGHAHGHRMMHLPVTTRTITCPTGLGSDSLPVPVTANGVDTYLADSMQFLLEYGMRLAPEGCYGIMHTFRGEDPDRTHLNQFLHSEGEIAGDLDDLIRHVEGYVRHLAGAFLEEQGAALSAAVGDVGHLERMATAAGGFPRLTFEEAVRLLEGDDLAVRDGGDWRTLTRHGERRLMEMVNEFVWVTNFDHLAVPFYQAFSDDSQRYASNADLFFGIGEVVGSGQRHTTGDELRKALAMHGTPERDYAWYVQMKEEFPMTTSGFGMGVERFLLWVLKHDDIRDIPLVSRVDEDATWPQSVERP